MNKIKTYCNLNRKSKWLGIIDYRLIIIFMVYVVVMYKLLMFFNVSQMYSLYITIITSMPIIGIYYLNIKEDNVLYMIVTVIKFYISPKLYIYKFNKNIINNKKTLKIRDILFKLTR